MEPFATIVKDFSLYKFVGRHSDLDIEGVPDLLLVIFLLSRQTEGGGLSEATYPNFQQLLPYKFPAMLSKYSYNRFGFLEIRDNR